MTYQQASDYLCQAGYSRRESDLLVARGAKHLRFMSAFDKARSAYKDHQMAGDNRSINYGDWGLMSGAEINLFFFNRTSSRLNPQTLYHFLLLRDENGVPSAGMIYTSSGSLIGEVRMLTPSGNVMFVAERWTDFVSWNKKLFVVPNTMLASQIARASVSLDGSFVDPVAVIFSSNGEARYFSRSAPRVVVVAGQYESVYPATPMHGKSTPVSVYRLPGDTTNGFGFTQNLEIELGRIQPKSLANDIVSMMSESGKISVSDLCVIINQCSNASGHFRNELVESYSLATGADKSQVVEDVSTAAAGVGHFIIAKKTFKIHQGQYCELCSNLSLDPVSNFWVSINHIAYRNENDIEYNITLYVDGKSCTQFVDHKTFSSPTELLKKLNAMAITSNMTMPVWFSQKYIFALFPQIIKGLAPKRIHSVKKGIIGFCDGRFTTDTWICDSTGIAVRKTELGELPFALEHPDLEDLREYRKKSEEQIKALCSTAYGASVLAGSIKILEAMKSGKSANMVVPQNILDGISNLLGLPKLDELLQTRMLQVVDRVMNRQKLGYHRATISVIDPHQKYNRAFIKMYDDVQTEVMNVQTKLFPYLTEMVLAGSAQKSDKRIEKILSVGPLISEYRVARSRYTAAERKLEEFAELVSGIAEFRQHISIDDDRTLVRVSVFSAMASRGHKFTKGQIAAELKSKYPSAVYPWRKRGGDPTCIMVPNPNIFTTKHHKYKEWMTRNISLT